jgi:DNA-directed RNA polymerase subunit RPC12/RpoP
MDKAHRRMFAWTEDDLKKDRAACRALRNRIVLVAKETKKNSVERCGRGTTMSYLCGDCDLVFDDPMVIIEDYGASYNHCPHCGSGNIDDAEQCERCTIVYPAAAMTEGYCPKCAQEIVARFKNFVYANFTVSERKVLQEHETLNGDLLDILGGVINHV